MIKGGYYIKARKIQESIIAHAPPHVREIWDWLLREANHGDNKYSGFKIERGQLFREYKDIRDGLSWFVGWRKETYNENHVKKAMKFLREHQMITTKKELGGVLITICNYDVYQNPKNYERTNERTNESTIAEPSLNQHIPYNNKNVKKEEELEEKKNKYKKILLSEINSDEYKEINNNHLEIAKAFQQLFIKNLEDVGIENGSPKNAKGTWIDDIRLMVDVDKITNDQFRTVFEFLKNDEFWKQNILCTNKLRKQFEKLLIKANYEGRKNNNTTTKNLLAKMENILSGVS